MRPAREITAEEENFRIEESGAFLVPRRNPIEPEPVGTIVLKAFKIIGYIADCDGSLMARMANIGDVGTDTGWEVKGIGLSHATTLVVTLEELQTMFRIEATQ